MADSPVFSRIDADRILKRAAEIDGAEDTRPLTIDELRSIAEEAGFGAQSVERAIGEAQRAVPTEIRHHPVQKSGWLITQLSTVRTIPIGISAEQLTRAVRLLQPYREGPAHVHLAERQITWRDRKGLKFTVTSGGGVTEVEVFLSKFLVRKGHWMGWVKCAADRLEELLFLVASQSLPAKQDAGPQPPRSRSAAAGS